MTYQLKFNSFTFPKGFYPASEECSAAIPSAKLPRADGAVQRVGYLDKKKLTVRGAIIRNVNGLSTMRTQMDNIKAAIRSGPANLYFDTDRYWRSAQAVACSFGWQATHYNRIVDTVSIDFESGDPFAYETTSNAVTASALTSGAMWTVTAGGEAYAQPAFALTFANNGTASVTVSNVASGESFSLAGSVSAGQVVTVDSLAEAVTGAGGADLTALFNGVFIRLLGATANALAINWGSTVSATAVVVSYVNRWY